MPAPHHRCAPVGDRAITDARGRGPAPSAVAPRWRATVAASALGGVILLAPDVAGAQTTPSTTTTSTPSTTTTSAPSTTTTTRAPSTTTTTRATSTTSTSTSTSSTTAVPSAADEDGASTLGWVLVAALVLAAVAVAVLLMRQRSGQRATSARWTDDEILALGRAEQIHDRAATLFGAWALDAPDQRTGDAAGLLVDLGRVRGDLHDLVGRAPDGGRAAGAQEVVAALDGLSRAVDLAARAPAGQMGEVTRLGNDACRTLAAAIGSALPTR